VYAVIVASTVNVCLQSKMKLTPVHGTGVSFEGRLALLRVLPNRGCCRQTISSGVHDFGAGLAKTFTLMNLFRGALEGQMRDSCPPSELAPKELGCNHQLCELASL